jgi:hypothetical protein
MKLNRRGILGLAALALAVAAGGTAFAATSQPGAAHVQYAKGVANGAGASAAYNAGTWTLDSGHGTGGSAQVDLVKPGTATIAPTFTADHEGAGNPRWVIEFHNGDYIFGYPASGAGQGVSTWTLEPSGKAEASYAAALADAQAGGSDDQVTAAFIVNDTGTTDTTVNLTDVTYNGNEVVPQPVIPYVYAGHVVNVTSHTAVVGWSESAKGWPSDNHCVEVYMYGFDTPAGTAHVGFTCDNGNRAADLGYMTNLPAGHSVSLFIRPAVGTYASHHPIAGTDAKAHVYVVTP